MHLHWLIFFLVTLRWVSDAKYCSFTQYAKAKKDLFEHLGLDKNDSQNIRMWPLTFNYYYEDYYYEFSPTNNTEFSPTNNTEFNPANNTEFNPANNTEFSPTNNTEFSPTNNTEFSPTDYPADYPADYPTFFSATIFVDLYVTSIINVNEKAQSLTTQVKMITAWPNRKMWWRIEDFCGITTFVAPRDMFWTPDIGIMESIVEIIFVNFLMAKAAKKRSVETTAAVTVTGRDDSVRDLASTPDSVKDQNDKHSCTIDLLKQILTEVQAATQRNQRKKTFLCWTTVARIIHWTFFVLYIITITVFLSVLGKLWLP